MPRIFIDGILSSEHNQIAFSSCRKIKDNQKMLGINIISLIF